MSFLDVVILGVVEGITEFLPVSSTGHLVLTADLLGLELTNFLKTFEIVIQLGAILAVVFLFWEKFIRPDLWPKLLISFLPTGIAGFFLYPVIKGFLGSPLVVVWALASGGVFIIWFERRARSMDGRLVEAIDLSWKQAFGIGVAQILSFVPGVSRAAASIFGGEIVGLSRVAAVEYSFLLAVPTMVAASSYDLYKNAASFSSADWQALSLGFFISFVVAGAVVKWLIRFVKTETLEVFGWYRLIVALLFFLFIV